MTVRKFRDAVIVMGAFLAIIWVLQLFNWADGYRLDADFGILPDHLSRLPDIFTAPFLHFSWQHIEGNSVPLFVLGVLAALIFGYFGYVLVRGFVDRSLIDIGVGAVAGVLYWTILQVALPGTPGISWIGHLGGLAGGLLAAWLVRSRTPTVADGLTGTGARTRAGAGGSPDPSDLLRELKRQGL